MASRSLPLRMRAVTSREHAPVTTARDRWNEGTETSVGAPSTKAFVKRDGCDAESFSAMVAPAEYPTMVIPSGGISRRPAAASAASMRAP